MYFENLLIDNDIDWKAIYMLKRKTAYNTYSQSFQYKILNNLFLNKTFFIFGFEASSLCSLCNLADETPYNTCYSTAILRSLYRRS